MPIVEAFVITNGRETFDYVLRSLKEQSVPINITVIKDMKWEDALNQCVKLCKSDYFIRIDDDMFLHRLCFQYYSKKITGLSKKCGVYTCRLWEEWSQKPIHGLRLYNTNLANKLQFRTSKLGKVDKLYRQRMEDIGFFEARDKSIVGVHALAGQIDQRKYRDLWRDKNCKLSPLEFSRTFDNKIHKVNLSLDDQYFMLSRMRKINSRYKTPYAQYIRESRLP